jgi:hypothetical protein
MLPTVDQMTKINKETLLIEFDTIMDRVEAGEFFLLVGDGPNLVLMPYNDFTKLITNYPDDSNADISEVT